MRCLLLALAASALACGPEAALDPDHDVLLEGGKADGSSYAPAEVAGILRAANEATLEELDLEAGLDVRAASAIVAQRPFSTLPALDAVAYVGPSALARLLELAEARGWVAAARPPCLLISEVVEGFGNYNKAVEIWNCGEAPLPLDAVGICLVRDGATACSTSALLDDATLAPGEVRVVCRTKAGTFSDPMEPLRAACQVERAGVMTFNGDDRLFLFSDDDASGGHSSGDTVLDALGQIARRPAGLPWSEKTLRRCRLEPYDGVARGYHHLEWFTQHGRTAFEDLGHAPTADGC